MRDHLIFAKPHLSVNQKWSRHVGCLSAQFESSKGPKKAQVGLSHKSVLHNNLTANICLLDVKKMHVIELNELDLLGPAVKVTNHPLCQTFLEHFHAKEATPGWMNGLADIDVDENNTSVTKGIKQSKIKAVFGVKDSAMICTGGHHL